MKSQVAFPLYGDPRDQSETWREIFSFGSRCGVDVTAVALLQRNLQIPFEA